MNSRWKLSRLWATTQGPLTQRHLNELLHNWSSHSGWNLYNFTLDLDLTFLASNMFFVLFGFWFMRQGFFALIRYQN